MAKSGKLDTNALRKANGSLPEDKKPKSKGKKIYAAPEKIKYMSKMA
jgi:hypothetical protein